MEDGERAAASPDVPARKIEDDELVRDVEALRGLIEEKPGGDWFRDEVETEDSAGGGDVYTPSGERLAYGAFLQDQINYSDWLEIIGGLRFDGYSLDGNQGGTDVSADGTKLSPRLTVGVSPFERTRLPSLQIYGTYAEGYRSPAVTETLISGMHPSGVTFPFLPNPDLKPESATTCELGLNFSRESLFRDEDRLRIKTAIFRNDVDDYIGLDALTPGIFGGDPNCPYAGPVGVIPTVPPTYYPLAPYPYVPACYQYVNIAKVRIKGFEFEGLYDAGSFFTGLTSRCSKARTWRPATRCSRFHRRRSPGDSASAFSTAGSGRRRGAVCLQRRRFRRAVRGELHPRQPLRVL